LSVDLDLPVNNRSILEKIKIGERVTFVGTLKVELDKLAARLGFSWGVSRRGKAH